MRKAVNHFKTITRHKIEVMKLCFSVGLIWQGLTHDLSKYSPEEFIRGCMFYQGYRSPNVEERNKLGYSAAWMHHKGRNKHHFEYWSDYTNREGQVLNPVRMPEKYLYEMVLDCVAASKVYKGDAYTDSAALEYYQAYKHLYFIHPETEREFAKLLKMLAKKGEGYTLKYIRNAVVNMRINKIKNIIVGFMS